MIPTAVVAGGLAAVVVIVVAGAGLTLFLARQHRHDGVLERRLRQVAAPLSGGTESTGTAAEEIVILRTERKRLGLWRLIEARYPLVNAPTALPTATGLGLLGGGAAVGALWFLRMPLTFWMLPVMGVATAVAAWLALAWLQRRLVANFVAKFPDSVDHLVRLSASGVPILEAVGSACQDAPHPVKPILAMLRDQLNAGIDPDLAARAVSERFRIPELTMFMAVIRLQRRSGGGITAAFTNLSQTLRERRQHALKAKASTGQTRLTLLILAVLPAIMLGIQSYTSPASIDLLMHTDSGTQLLRWGFGLIAVGLYITRIMASNAAR